jgi:lipoprotein-anchoring transpeptidase ErfK/SrfK
VRPALPLAVSVLVASAIAAAVPPTASAERPPPLLAVQVLLDRAGFSPGEIDGRAGPNTTKALEAFQRARGLEVTGRADPRTRKALRGVDDRDVVVTRTLSESDVAGPWLQVPEDLMAQAFLPALGYASPLERLAEQVHASPALLRALNPAATFDRPGEVVRVPDVAPATADRSTAGAVGTSGVRTSAETGRGRDVLVRVSKRRGALTVTDDDGTTRMHAPVTVGSEHDPLPVGEWRVTGIERDPVFHYNPDLFWDADPAHAKAVLRPGPNNPVGVVWIGIDREHYGLHGTPEPGEVGHSVSHGCVRLTNWDALRLASLVRRGSRVVFEE